jgi:hypothetical protein
MVKNCLQEDFKDCERVVVLFSFEAVNSKHFKGVSNINVDFNSFSKGDCFELIKVFGEC